MDTSVLTEDTVVWEPDMSGSIIYSQDNTLIVDNSGEAYLTAREDNTQYFSVLEDSTSQLINSPTFPAYCLAEDELQTAVNNAIEDCEESAIEYSIGKIYIFPSDNPINWTAFQMYYNDEGTLCKRIYKMNLNAMGEYERIPDTLQELPVEMDVMPDSQEIHKDGNFEFEQKQDDSTDNLYQTEEQELLQEFEEQALNEQTLTEHFIEQQILQEEQNFDGTLSENQQQIAIKQETYHEQYLINDNMPNDENSEENEHFPTTTVNADNTLLNIKKVENALTTHVTENEVEATTLLRESTISEPFEEVYVATHEDVDIRNFNENTNYEFLLEQSESEEENFSKISNGEASLEEDSEEEEINKHRNTASMARTESNCGKEYDSDEYEIVDGVHVTAENLEDKEVTYERPKQQILRQQSAVFAANNILVNENLDDKLTNKENLMLYLIRCPEKENLGLKRTIVTGARNPRSLLKTSYPAYQQQQKEKAAISSKAAINNKSTNVTINSNNGRRSIKNRPSFAQHFHNYLAQTTIVQAPIRSHRLPRKQTHTLVRRPDEDVIVQEVVVSSNGFVETSEDGVVMSKVPLKPSLIVNLSDSDEDEPKTSKTRKKRRIKQKSVDIPEIVIPDTDDEDQQAISTMVTKNMIVQIDLSSVNSDDDGTLSLSKNSKKKEILPRKRGRPPKVNVEKKESICVEKTVLESEKVGPKEKIDTKTKWKCSECPRILPSEGSLKTHMHIHRFNKPGNVRKSFAVTDNKASTKQTLSLFECSICKKSFKIHTEFLNHKRVHVKQRMVQVSTLVNSPKLTRKSKVTTPKEVDKASFKCKHCTKCFATSLQLRIHMKSHKVFRCLSCTCNFISKLALEDHVRNNCVKLNNKVGPSTVPATRRVSQRLSATSGAAKSAATNGNQKAMGRDVSSAMIKCDVCSLTFKLRSALDKHKLMMHQQRTPIKRTISSNGTSTAKKSVKKIGEHASVPASIRLRKAYSAIRQKLYK